MKEEQIKELVEGKSVGEVINKAHLQEVLSLGKKLRVKFGIDPTAPDLHLGHAVVLRKLAEFQKLGHKLVLIIGDFTAQIGDPSGKNKTRPPLTEKEIKANMKNYLKQASKVINVKRAEIHYNSKWLKKLQGPTLIKLLSLVSVQQIIERDDFEKRITAKESVRMHELLYPIMQAYDSVMVKADLECGGTDQTFNFLLGRTLMEKHGLPPQDILTTPLLEGLDGERKMSKSYGNVIGLSDTPDEMFGKTMSLPDKVMLQYFMLCTDIQEQEAKSLIKKSPRDAKVRLGYEVVRIYHGESAAKKAQENFEKKFVKKDFNSAELLSWKVKRKELSVLELLMSPQDATRSSLKSKIGWQRLVQDGAIQINGKVKKDWREIVQVEEGDVLKTGKHTFFKIEI